MKGKGEGKGGKGRHTSKGREGKGGREAWEEGTEGKGKAGRGREGRGEEGCPVFLLS